MEKASGGSSLVPSERRSRTTTTTRTRRIRIYKKAIELAPERIVHHAEYAKALDVLGDSAGARQQWTKVAELKPVWAQDRRYQAMAMRRLRAR